MVKSNPWGQLEKANEGNNKSLNDEFKDLLLVLPKNISIDMSKIDFENIQNLGKNFLNLLEKQNNTSKEFLKSIEILIGIKNISKFFKGSDDIFINRIIYELRSAFIGFQYNNNIKNSYPVTEKIDKILSAIKDSKLDEEFNQENLGEINKKAKIRISENKTREIPLSYIIKIPLESGNNFWILFEKKGNITYENLKKIKKESKEKNFINEGIIEVKDTFITIFFGEKEPSDIKIKTTQDRHKNSITSPIFRDEIGTFIMYASGNSETILDITLKEKFQKLEALVILGLSPVLLRKHEVEEIYGLYGLEISDKNNGFEEGQSNKEPNKKNTTRKYPYGINKSISDLMESEDKEEENKKVIHKRLLPLIKSSNGEYNGAKPSNKAKEVSEIIGFELKLGIGFPKRGTCIYPEKINELFDKLGVKNIEDAIIELRKNGEEVYIRYETIVIPSQKKESKNDVSETVKATVGNIIKK